MVDTRYIVDIDLRLHDHATKTLDKMSDAIGPLDKGFLNMASGMKQLAGSIGGKFVGVLDSAASKLASMGKYAAMGGAAAAVGGLTYGVTKLNAEIDKTKISMAAVFNANKISTGGMMGGLKMAEGMYEKMRQDAKQLPGELEDLLYIYRAGVIPAIHQGLDPDKFREMSSKVMAAAAVAGMDMHMAGREFALLMEGRSGAHNVLGQRLMGLSGAKASAFNKLSGEKRIALLSAELDKFGGAIGVFGKSWEGVTSTFVDGVKQLGAAVTKPLFDKLSRSLGDANKWIDENGEKLSSWAYVVGTKIAAAFEWGRAKIEEWWPAIEKFATSAWAKLKQVWVDLAPHVERVGNAIHGFLKDPAAVDKLISLGKLYLALKVGQGALGVQGGISQAASSTVLPFLTNGGGGALGAFAGTGTGALSAIGALLGEAGGSTAAAYGVSAAGGGALAGGATLAAFAAGIALAYNEVMLFTEVITHFRDDAQKTEDAKRDYAKRHIASYIKMTSDMRSASDKWATVTEYAARDINNLRLRGDEAGAALYELELAAYSASAAMDGMSKFVNDRNSDIVDPAMAAVTAKSGQVAREWLAKQPKGRRVPKHGGGGGGTSIQKVEIVVTSNQHPSRIARTVFDEMAKLKRNRRSSPHVTNFSNPNS